LAGWAAVVLIAWLSLEDFSPLFWRSMIRVGLELAVAAGLLLHQRWGWVLGIVTAVFLVGEGLSGVASLRGAEFVVLVGWMLHYFIPAIVLLVCLLPARARRAYLRG